ncbi:ribosome-binding factor A [Deinococcus sonorensis]|uniref:Ribosome-binding factor A n=2 Tax=Deinococcus sonorensis TaxID=309891 RepID=A0AAU7UDD5_9DEIO
MKPRQVEAALSRLLSGAIHDLRDPRVPLIVTIERVTVTSDYGLARVYVSSIGDVDALVEALNHARGRLQREAASQLKLRRTPQLEFFGTQAMPFLAPESDA